MNTKIWYVIIVLLVALPLLLGSCSGGTSNSTASSKPGPGTPGIPSEPEAPLIQMPAADKTKLPVIVFSVAPASIAPGATAVLSWSVTNATSVTIDHGIGTVSASGTKNVSPAAPTTYKLTAANTEGSAIKTISLAVIPPTSPPKTMGK